MPVGYGDNPPVPPKGADPQEPRPTRRERRRESIPAAGPHDDPALTNPDSTPGTGALPPPGTRDGTESTSS